jgi:hypothetical protein
MVAADSWSAGVVGTSRERQDRLGRRVFVSYSRSDRRLARQLVKELKAAGHIVWIDEAGIDAGEVWAQEIVEAIRTSQVFVLLATTASVRSKDVRKEVDVAGKYGIPIVPAVVPPVRIPAQIEYHISGRHQVTIDPDDTAAGFSALAAELDAVRPARREARRWVPGLVLLVFVGLVGLGIWTVASGVFPPWDERPECEFVSAAVVATTQARFGTFEGGATLDVVVENRNNREANVPAAREVNARGASGIQYAPSDALADQSWFFGVDLQPNSTARLQLGLSSPTAGSDTVAITIPGVAEGALPFFKCKVTLAPVEVAFAAG